MKSTARQTKEIDKILGKKVRAARILADLSQHELGDLIGVTFQQVQKYECGSNRLTVSRLLDICRVLNLKVADLLEEDAIPSMLKVNETSLKLLGYYEKIPNESLKKQLLHIAKTLAS